MHVRNVFLAFPKQRKRKAEELKTQFMQKMVPTGVADIGKASGLSSCTTHARDNQRRKSAEQSDQGV